MTVQMRPHGGGIAYAPARDIVYLYPDIVKDVAGRLEDHAFAPMHDWLEKEGVSLDELGEACGAYCTFMNLAHEDPRRGVEDSLEAAGWFEVKWQARVAYMFYIGAMMTGTFHRGIRDITPLGGETIAEVKQLRWVGRRAQLVMSMSRWQRRLYKWSKWWKRKVWKNWRVRDD